MTHHDWSDKNFDWKALDDCVNIVYRLRKWGRLGGHVKEKFGCLRWYVDFGYLSLHKLIYPDYVYNQFPTWLWNLDCDYIGPFLRYVFEKPFVFWQRLVYNWVYWKCLKKHPHIRAEILCDADYPEFIKGVTRREGKDLHILGWNGEVVATWTSG